MSRLDLGSLDITEVRHVCMFIAQTRLEPSCAMLCLSVIVRLPEDGSPGAKGHLAGSDFIQKHFFSNSLSTALFVLLELYVYDVNVSIYVNELIVSFLSLLFAQSVFMFIELVFTSTSVIVCIFYIESIFGGHVVFHRAQNNNSNWSCSN